MLKYTLFKRLDKKLIETINIFKNILMKRTWQPKKKKRQTTHGFRSTSDNVKKNRRRKGRKSLSV